MAPGDLIQQLLPPVLQPVAIMDRRRHSLRDRCQVESAIELLSATIELFECIHMSAAAKCRRLKRRRNFFIGKDAEIGEYEFAPVLVKIAEEHQPKPLAQRRDDQLINPISRLFAPRLKRLRTGTLGAQDGDELGLFAGAVRPYNRKIIEHFCFRKQSLQLFHIEIGSLVDPAQLHQRRCRRGRIADFRVVQSTAAKHRAVARNQSNQQCSRCARQRMEAVHELPLLQGQKLRVASFYRR